MCAVVTSLRPCHNHVAPTNVSSKNLVVVNKINKIIRGAAFVFIAHPRMLYPMLRSYHVEYTGSHQNSEVKLRWAGLVLC